MNAARASTPARGSWLLRTAVVGVLLLAAGAFVLSYSALHAVAVAAGINPGLAGLYPLIIDGFITIASLAALFLRDHGPRVTWYPWSLLGGFFTVSVWCNALHAASRTGHITLTGGTAALVSAMPPVALGLAIHLLILMLRPSRAASDTQHERLANTKAEAPRSRPAIERVTNPRHVNGVTRPGAVGSATTMAADQPPQSATTPARPMTTDGDDLRTRAARTLHEAKSRNVELTGAELGRSLGISTRHGRRLLNNLGSACGPRPSAESDTEPSP